MKRSLHPESKTSSETGNFIRKVIRHREWNVELKHRMNQKIGILRSTNDQAGGNNIHQITIPDKSDHLTSGNKFLY